MGTSADPDELTTVRISPVVFATSTPGFRVFSHFSALINCRLARGGISHRKIEHNRGESGCKLSLEAIWMG